MTWRVEAKTTGGELAWLIEADTADEFRRTLNRLGREAGISFASVLEVTFRRLS